MKAAPEFKLPKSNDDAAKLFLAELLRHFHQDPPDVKEDLAEVASA